MLSPVIPAVFDILKWTFLTVPRIQDDFVTCEQFVLSYGRISFISGTIARTDPLILYHKVAELYLTLWELPVNFITGNITSDLFICSAYWWFFSAVNYSCIDVTWLDVKFCYGSYSYIYLLYVPSFVIIFFQFGQNISAFYLRCIFVYCTCFLY